MSYEPAELVLTARAATPLATIEARCARTASGSRSSRRTSGRCSGPSAPQTIGGVLAANLAGSRRVTAGAARDHFLGFHAVTGRGEPFKAGGKVVKNVTGYDLPKLLAGSWGTLAVLTEVTIRVAPAPELDRTLVVAAGSTRRMPRAARRGSRLGARRFGARRSIRLEDACSGSKDSLRPSRRARARFCDELAPQPQ